MNALEPSAVSVKPVAPRPPRRVVRMSTAPPDEMTLSPEAQVRLVAAIAASADRQAYAILFRHFAPRVKTFLMRSGLPALTAEELAQETLLSVWRKASYFDPGRAGVATWIFTIARNLRIDHLRQQRRRDVQEEDPSEEADAPPTGEAVLITAEREAIVRRALTQLSDEQATVVKLSYFGEKPHSEIASELGIPIGTVKSRIRLAMLRLRALVDDLR